MVKKQKTGKQRKDKFYNLAKETGYRSRASFKLLQLNRKFNFLQRSRICIDLCAAPGGWLQVAQQHMPQSSVIIGVDLVPIKPIPNTITFTSDITSDECRNRLRKEMKDWKADVVLHDGAGNVGANWLHDAYSQCTLTLQAFKLACEMLRKGGWFITKVFRSSDYNSLMWIFQQLFEKVHGTKPAASRNESAEIFVVCQGFKAPDTIDKRFFDIKSVFEGVEEDTKRQTILKDFNEGKKKKALGYAETVSTSMHVKKTVTEFLACSNPLNFIADVNQLIFDQEYYKTHYLTTPEIIECCLDIKVLGAGDVKLLKKWYNKMTKELHKEVEELKLDEEKGENKTGEDGAELGSDAEMEEIDTKLLKLKQTEVSELKRKKKLKMRALKKLRRAIADTAPSAALGLATGEDEELFSLKRVLSKKEEVYYSDSEDDLEFSDSGSDGEGQDLLSGDEDEILEAKHQKRKDKKRKLDEGEQPTLIKEAQSKKKKTMAQMNMWFTKPIFDGMDEDITDMELDLAAKRYKVDDKKVEVEAEVETVVVEVPEVRSEAVIEESKISQEEVQASVSEEEVWSEEEFSTDSEDEGTASRAAFACRGPGWSFVDSGNKEERMPTKENGGLTAEELAVATEMSMSRKKKREYIENSYNRYTVDDDEGAVPEWFLSDEKVHQRPDSGPSVQGSENKELVDFYKNREKSANVRTIKKVAEAKARKRKKLVAIKERTRKSADGVLNTSDMGEREKSAMVKSIYKKAGLSMRGGLKERKEAPKVIRASKGVGKRVRRPAGVKGPFKVVDSRMKNDLRHKKNRQRESEGKGKPKNVSRRGKR